MFHCHPRLLVVTILKNTITIFKGTASFYHSSKKICCCLYILTSLCEQSGILEGCRELAILSKHNECLCMYVDAHIDTSDSPCKQVLFVWSRAMVTTSLREGEDCV